MKFLLAILYIGLSVSALAQTGKKSSELFYGYVLAAGTGTSPLFEEKNWGISGMLAFEIEKNYYVSSLGYRLVSEFQILGVQSPSNKSKSLELLIGRKLLHNKINLSVHSGVSLVTSVVRGAFLYSNGTLFGRREYEKYSINNFGLPISLRVFSGKAAHTQLGLEAYSNINKYYAFYAINLCLTINKLSFGKK